MVHLRAAALDGRVAVWCVDGVVRQLHSVFKDLLGQRSTVEALCPGDALDVEVCVARILQR
jgi:hypothetical protein